MGLVIKPKVAPTATPPAGLAAGEIAVEQAKPEVAQALVDAANTDAVVHTDGSAEGVAEVVVESPPAISETPAPAPVKKGGLTIVKKPAGSPELQTALDTIAALPASEVTLKPGDEGFQAQVAKAFNMDTVIVNGISTLTPKKAPSAVVAPQDAAPASSPFAGSDVVLNGQGENNPVIAMAVASVIKTTENMDAIQQAEQEAGYTILDALTELVNNRIGTLMFVNRESGLSYKVTGHNPKTGITTMLNSANIKLHPILTEREVAQYRPVWR